MMPTTGTRIKCQGWGTSSLLKLMKPCIGLRLGRKLMQPYEALCADVLFEDFPMA